MSSSPEDAVNAQWERQRLESALAQATAVWRRLEPYYPDGLPHVVMANLAGHLESADRCVDWLRKNTRQPAA